MKRRKKIVAWACVGSHDSPFYCMSRGDGGPTGQLEIFNSQAEAERVAHGPRYVRRCEIFIEREPAQPQRR